MAKRNQSPERDLRAVVDDLRAGAWGKPHLMAVNLSRIERARKFLRSQSARLIRWLEEDDEREIVTIKSQLIGHDPRVVQFYAEVWDPKHPHERLYGVGETRNAAISAALDRAEAVTSR